MRNVGGRPIRVVGALRDVTERKISEEATLRLAAIVTSASDAIVGKTTEGIVTSWNAAAERMFGYSEREMVGSCIFTLIPEELHEDERTLLARVRQGERVEISTAERFRKDGSRILIALSVSPIWDASGRVLGVSSIKRDVTERQRAELELARREERTGRWCWPRPRSSGPPIPRATSSSPRPTGSGIRASRGRSIAAQGG